MPKRNKKLTRAEKQDDYTNPVLHRRAKKEAHRKKEAVALNRDFLGGD